MSRELETWEVKVLECAQAFAQSTHGAFLKGLEVSLPYLPEDTPANRQIQLSNFLEAIIGQAVAEVAENVGCGLEVERKFTDSVRVKFESARRFEEHMKTGAAVTPGGVVLPGSQQVIADLVAKK